MLKSYKTPISVLVVVHTPDLQVLLLERADHPGYWQSVTGSQDPGETLYDTARREVKEETGLNSEQFRLVDWGLHNDFEIFQEWRHRYEPGVTQNTEHAFGMLVPRPMSITISPREHIAFIWLPYAHAADKVFSWTNAAALRKLPEMLPLYTPPTDDA